MRSGRPSRQVLRWPRLLLLGVLLLGASIRPAHSQFTRFENYSEEQGLGNESVSALAQDPQGYVLLGTEAGLYRFDGSSIKPYDVTVGLPSGAWVRKIAVDGAGRVWVVTSDGLYVRNGSRFTVVDIGRPLTLKSTHVIGFFDGEVVIDDAGRLLRATIGARGTGPFSPLLDAGTLAAIPGLSSARFVSSDRDGGLLIGCGTGICRMKAGRVATYGPADGLPADEWQTAIQAPDGTVWARSLRRLAWLPPRQSVFGTATLPEQEGHSYDRIAGVLDLLADRRGGVITQSESGLLQWDGATWHHYVHHAGGLAATPLEALFLDREGSVWAGSIGHGAFRGLGFGRWEHWTADDGLRTDIVWGMTRLRGGQFWVATFGDTVRLDGRSAGIPGGSADVEGSRAGLLWAAPPDAPLVRLDPGTGRTEQFPSIGHVATAFVDHDDRLWLCSVKGLYLIADADAPASAVHAVPVLPHPAFQVSADPAGRLWALTRDGLYRRDGDGRFTMMASSVLPEGEMGGLAFASAGELWITTESEGIIRFAIDRDRLRPLARIAAPLIGSNEVLFLHRDRRNWMWLGTDHGIDMFDGRAWHRFDKVDGLISNDMDQWAIYEDRDGSMWFGTSHGLTHLLDPGRLPTTASLHPRVTAISIGRHSLPLSSSIRVNWSSAPLVIRFADLDFARGDVAFRFRLHGLDTDWNDTVGHDVRYAGLPAGHFLFELIALDVAHGIASAPIRIAIDVRAPWWRRWWFYGLSSLAIATLLSAAWQARERLLLRQQRKLEEMVGVRTAEIEQARNDLQRLALTDALTGLPNRRAVMARLEEAVALAVLLDTPLAILLCDIDHFKKINDGFGHLAGDAVLAAFGIRLSEAIGADEAAGRYGGEEFLIILPRESDTVGHRVEEIHAAITDAPYIFGDREQPVTSSGGVAFLRSGDTAVTLVARADVALYRAKDNGRNRIEREEAKFDASNVVPDQAGRAATGEVQANGAKMPGLKDERLASDRLAQQRRDLEADLRVALADGQFLLYYQPVVDIRRGMVTSFEALLRWRSPTRGNVSPVDFIPFAETVGLMTGIGEWVLRAACREAATWPDTIKVSVNLSPSQFHSADLLETIRSVLRETGLAPDRLELEVTETAMIDDMAAAVVMLEQLRGLGITIALDDFGTGYSSLSFVRTLPFDRIKIDRSFVTDLGVRPEAAAIISAIAGLCGSLKAELTAEGVESEEQIELLRLMGCTELQGYGIGRPCPASDLPPWLTGSPVRPAVAPAPKRALTGTRSLTYSA